MSFISTCLYSKDYYVNTWACLVGCRNIENKNDPYHQFETKFYKLEQKLCCQTVSNKLKIKNLTCLFLILFMLSLVVVMVMVMIQTTMEFLVSSWWEIKVTVAASVFVIFAYWFFTYRIEEFVVDRSLGDVNSLNLVDHVNRKVQFPVQF